MHRWSQLFIPTLREAPVEAEIASQRLLLRAGYIRQFGPGLYSYLFLGRRSLLKIENIVRQELDRVGQEFSFPPGHPRESITNERSQRKGRDAFYLEDRAGQRIGLSPTDEEVVADIAGKELRSYRQLPQIWYQICTRFRDENRPRYGLLHPRESFVSDSYSLDLNVDGLETSYRKHFETYARIFDRCDLTYVLAEGGGDLPEVSQAQECLALTDAGDDVVAMCDACQYAANVEVASSRPLTVSDIEGSVGTPVEVSTPTQKTIEEVAAFLEVNPSQVIKSYLAVAIRSCDTPAAQVPVVVFLRGDHSVNETKLRLMLNRSGSRTDFIRPMEADEIRECFGLEPGFIGPVGLLDVSFPIGGRDKWQKPLFLFDLGLRDRKNLIAGANKPGRHLAKVTPNTSAGFRVTEGSWVDVSTAVEGDGCPKCGATLVFRHAIKIGRVAKSNADGGTRRGCRVTDDKGKEVMLLMGTYRVWLDRILAACVEQHHDDNGFWLSPSIAPFQVVVTPTSVSDGQIEAAAENIAQALDDAGIGVLLDDRDERPGVKFKDSDLIGVPYRINIGKRIVEGEVELFQRSSSEKENVRVGDVVPMLRSRIVETEQV